VKGERRKQRENWNEGNRGKPISKRRSKETEGKAC
jgi:ribosomal protein L44E